jgi:hypothetical protein
VRVRGVELLLFGLVASVFLVAIAGHAGMPAIPVPVPPPRFQAANGHTSSPQCAKLTGVAVETPRRIIRRRSS